MSVRIDWTTLEWYQRIVDGTINMANTGDVASYTVKNSGTFLVIFCGNVQSTASGSLYPRFEISYNGVAHSHASVCVGSTTFQACFMTQSILQCDAGGVIKASYFGGNGCQMFEGQKFVVVQIAGKNS